MNAYVVSFLAGVLVGVVYFVLGVRSPAPPIIALIGLLGMVVGEAAAPRVRSLFVTKTHSETVTPNTDRTEQTK